jgi:hypothetical protein
MMNPNHAGTEMRSSSASMLVSARMQNAIVPSAGGCLLKRIAAGAYTPSGHS